jgi:chromosome segregation ATPase
MNLEQLESRLIEVDRNVCQRINTLEENLQGARDLIFALQRENDELRGLLAASEERIRNVSTAGRVVGESVAEIAGVLEDACDSLWNIADASGCPAFASAEIIERLIEVNAVAAPDEEEGGES